MKKIFNYKGLLFLWVTLFFLVYGYKKAFPAPIPYRGDKDEKSWNFEQKVLLYMPYLFGAGFVFILGIGHLSSSNEKDKK